MNRQPPRSTLFPYTTLSRSVEATEPTDQGGDRQRRTLETRLERIRKSYEWGDKPEAEYLTERAAILRQLQARSEEHTSELQSRQYLVCRLLLEKKKNTKQIQ